MSCDIDTGVLHAHHHVRVMETELEDSQRRRMLAFALAAEKGKSSGHLARLTGVTPMQAIYFIRTGGQLISRRRAADERRAA